MSVFQLPGTVSTAPIRRAAAAPYPLVFWLIGLVLCLLPLEWWLFPYSLKVADVGLVLLLVIGALQLVTRGHRVHLHFLLPFWTILTASVISTVAGVMHADSFVAILQEIYLYAWFVVAANLLSRFPMAYLDGLMKLWSVAAVFEATATFLGMMHRGPAMFYTNPNGMVVQMGVNLDRAVGTFANSNAAAGYLFISFFVLLAARWPAWFKVLAGAWLIAGIFATGSMGALLAVIAGFVVLVLLFVFRERWSKLAGLAVLVGALLILAAFVWILASNVSPVLAESDLFRMTIGRLPRSLMSRVTLAQRVFPIYLQYPLGIGPNASVTFFGSLHNDYLAFLFERGPLGFAGWLWLILSVLALPLRAARRAADRQTMWVILALGAGFVAVCVNSFTHELSHFRQVWMLMAFLVAVCAKTEAAH